MALSCASPHRFRALPAGVCRVEAKRAEVAAALEAVEQSHALAAQKEQAVHERAARHQDKSAEAKNKEEGG